MNRVVAVAAMLVVLLMTQGCAMFTQVELSREQRMARQVVFTVADRPVDQPAPGEAPASSYASGFTGGQDAMRPDVAGMVGSILNLHQLKMISQWSINALGLKAIVAEIRGPQRVERVLQGLRRDSRVETVEPMKSYDLLTYNDPYFHMQTGSVKGTDIEHIHALTTGRDVVVAVVDTGVDREHPELANQIILARNFVEGDPLFDVDEHGTSVAGVISSAANNELGIVGVAPGAKLMALKACSQDVNTRRARCDSFSIIKALVEVLKLQPDVLNLSLAGPPDPLIAQLLEAASARGIIVVAAIDQGNSESFPASLEYVLGVNAPSEGLDAPMFGVLAPGIDILTTAPGATYAFRSGSSMASAYVSGIAALLKEKLPALSTAQLVAHLQSTALTRVNALPVVDICAAVTGVFEDGGCPTEPAIAARPPERAIPTSRSGDIH